MKVEKYIVWFAVLLLVGCGPKAPQIPSQRKGQAPQVDSAQLALMELNRQLAQTADEQLAVLVQAQPETYALYENNSWCTLLEVGDTDRETPKPGEEWSLHVRVYSLSGKLYLDSEGTYHVGKLELPPAVDSNIFEWHHGARLRIFAPWYSAYGITGTDIIPPYENVMIELELK